ncbi:MAG: fumarylacetoacetate hydrolase family protein [Arcanobacterium sp.]|nr:fumarylacetoacetate hydrolase family protein [Arcanobacterium sp.]
MRFATVKINGESEPRLVLEKDSQYYPIAQMRCFDELLRLISSETEPVVQEDNKSIVEKLEEFITNQINFGTELDEAEISEFLPPVLNPTKVICVGVNYRDHIKEMGREIEKAPTLFPKFAQSLLGANQPLRIPFESEKLDYEAELAVIIGKEMRRVSITEALSGIAGYTCANDGSIRDWQVATSQWMAGKAWDGLTPIGPVVVTPNELPNKAKIQSRVNGEVRQNSQISELLFDAPTLISYISTFTKLLPGDVILTGTPGGVGVAMKPPSYLKAGDFVEVEIEGIGILRNSVV